MKRHARRKPAVVSRDIRYNRALEKIWRSQRPNPDEARELRRRRLADGSYPVPAS